MRTTLVVCLLGSLLFPVTAVSRTAPSQKAPPVYYVPTGQPVSMDRDLDAGGVVAAPRAAAASDTTWLLESNFDTALIEPDAQGWLSNDGTEQTALYFHVADFTELDGGTYGYLLPLEGAQSMWCGIPAGDPLYCDYAALPGYGPHWDVSFVSDFFYGNTASLTYRIFYYTEAGYDFVYVDYETGDGNWTATTVNGGAGSYDGIGDVTDTFSTAIPDSVRFRFRFRSDVAYDDRDGLIDTDGALLLDSVVVETNLGLFFEDFEDEYPGESQVDQWHTEATPGFGDFAALYPGFTVLQEDFCTLSWNHMWAFINGSTDNYGCGGHPDQLVVPMGNSRGQYIVNDVWSPTIPFVGTGSRVVLQFDVYLDLPLDNLVFYMWHVRSITAGCVGSWQGDGRIGMGDSRGWITETVPIDPWIDPAANDIQVSLGVIDLCESWCGWYGTGACHSHAPMFDNIRVGRVNASGPQWTVLEEHLFQDTFSDDGTLTGTGRADMAMDILPPTNPGILPGDSVVVTCLDIQAPLAADPYTLVGPAVYCYVSLLPQGDPGKNPFALEASEGRFPFVDQFTDNGVDWYVYRMDTVYADPGMTIPVDDEYCFDLNDNLLTPGDTIQYFFGAENILGQHTYWSEFTGTVHNTAETILEPMEFQVLPGGGWLNGGDILYVDAFDGRGAQPYFDWAFWSMDIDQFVDRYDVRAPSSNVSNNFSTRATLAQILSCYRTIIYNSGDLSSGTIGDGGPTAAGTGADKSDECLLFHFFLELHPSNALLYLSGDDLADELSGLIGTGALGLKTQISYTVVGDHVAAGFPITPLAVGEPGSIFDDVGLVDTVYADGGCLTINDFDVLTPTNGSVMEMTYEGTGQPSDGAVIMKSYTNTNAQDVYVVLSGFSYHYLRDDRTTEVMDRDDHLYDILSVVNILPQPWFQPPPPTRANKLFQNYRNPFNPTTVIRYSIKETSPVTLKVYNVAGQLVRTLVDEVLTPESVRPVEWDGRNENGQQVASGVYFYRLVTRGYVATKKMVLLK